MSDNQTSSTVNNTVPSRSDSAAQAKWYIVHTYSGYENKVLTTLKQKVENMGLQDQFLDVVIPVEKVREIVKKRVKGKDGKFKKDEYGDYIEEDTEVITEIKIFPSYVFIKMIMSDDNQNVVRSVRGCTGFVGLNSMNATEKVGDSIIHNAPPALSDDEVAELGLESGSDNAKTETVFRFGVGDSVRIIGQYCPFEDPVCTVESIDEENNTVTVIGIMFGRKIPADLPVTDVEPAE